MADLENRHADARECQEVALDLFEDGYRQHGRTGGEVVDAAHGGQMVTRWRSRMSGLPPCIAVSNVSDGAPSRLMRATAACAPSKMTFSVSCTLMLPWRKCSNTCARTPGRSRWRTTSMCVAGVFFARFTTFGTFPVSLYDAMMRTVSAAIASCA